MSKYIKKNLQNLVPYTPGEQPQNQKLIKLNTNENPYPPSPKVIKAIMNEQNMRLYPDPTANDGIEEIAKYYGLEKNQVALGNGSDEILAFVFMAYGEKIYFPEISYGFYPVFGQVFESECVEMPLDKNLKINIEDYMNLDGTIIIANPNAPTGLILTLEEIEKILVSNKDNVVIIDEAYIDFGGESAVKFINKYENLLIVQTFSKSRSLAGMRIGMALGNDKLIEDINKIKFSFNPYNLSREAIIATKESMADREYFLETTKKIIETREYFTEKMLELGYEVLPSKANFVFVKTGIEYFEKLRAHNIIVRHFNKDKIKDYVRITIGTRNQMEELLKVTEEIK